MEKKITYDKVLSLGSTCYPKLFTNKYLKLCETELFDYIGTSMWAINELLLNDFENLVNETYFIKVPIFQDGPEIVINGKYYLRFKHDLQDLDMINFKPFQEKYLRRISRFKNTMNVNSNILFIRLQETQKNRIRYNDRQINEYDELDKFLSIMNKQYQNKVFTIIYINDEKDGWNLRRDILSIKVDSIESWDPIDNKLVNLLMKEQLNVRL